jgi:hypothetical protein
VRGLNKKTMKTKNVPTGEIEVIDGNAILHVGESELYRIKFDPKFLKNLEHYPVEGKLYARFTDCGHCGNMRYCDAWNPDEIWKGKPTPKEEGYFIEVSADTAEQLHSEIWRELNFARSL